MELMESRNRLANMRQVYLSLTTRYERSQFLRSLLAQGKQFVKHGSGHFYLTLVKLSILIFSFIVDTFVL